MMSLEPHAQREEEREGDTDRAGVKRKRKKVKRKRMEQARERERERKKESPKRNQVSPDSLLKMQSETDRERDFLYPILSTSLCPH